MRAYGDQNMSWQGLRDVARGQTRYWPDGRVNAVYPNGDGARHIPIFTERYPEWVWRYYVATGDRGTALSLYPSTQKVADYIWAARDPATGLLNGFAEGNSNSDPVFGYDQSVTLDTTSNVLGVNAFNRIAQLAMVAGDTTGATTQMARAADTLHRHQLPTDAPHRDLYGRVAARRSAERPCLPRGQRLGPGLRGGAGPPRRRGRRLRGRTGHRGRSGPWARAPARSGQRRTGPGHGPHPDRYRHTGLGPHRGLRRHLHLGNLDTERSHRRLDVPWVGLLRPGRHARNTSGRHPASPRPTTGRSWPPSFPRRRGCAGPEVRSRRSPDRSRSRGARIERSSRSPPSSRPMRPPGSPSPPRERRRCGRGAAHSTARPA